MYDHRRDRREERHEARHERHDRGGRYDDDNYDNRGSQHHRRQQYDDDDSSARQSYPYGQGGGGAGRGYAPPSGPPPAAHGPPAFSSQGGLDRGDFASDADIDQMLTSGKFGSGQQGRGAGGEYGRYDAPSGPPSSQGNGGRGNEYGQYDAPSGPPTGQGYGGRGNDYEGRRNDYGGRGNERYDAPSGPPGQGHGGRGNEYGRYDAPSGPPSGQGYGGRYDAPQGPPSGRSQQPHQDYESGRGGYSGGPDRQNQYGSQPSQGRPQYDSLQAPQNRSDYGKSQSSAPSGGFSVSHGEDQYRSGYTDPRDDRDEPPRRGEAASYYNQQGLSGDRYAHSAGIANEHGNDDPEVYRRATQGLQGKIQSQGQRRPNDDDDEYKAHVDAHRKAYGDDDHGPMDADAIGSAAAIEAIKQAAATAGSSNAPAGAFKTSSGASSGRVARAEEKEEDAQGEAAARAGTSGGLQDKLMALAMSQAGKLFDKKNAGASGGDKTQGKEQAMQSAAATAMQLFAKYQGNGKLDSSDMSTVMGLAMKML